MQLLSTVGQTSASWAGYITSKFSLPPCYEPAIISFLPIIRSFVHSLAMIAHFMKLFKSAVERITPSQIPVIAVDQPLIPLVEQTQWTLGEMYNEDKRHNAWRTPY